jgi:toluene monooxygenase system protein A
MVMPGPEERDWLRAKYPESWPSYEPIWERLDERWRASGPGVEWYTHGTTPIGFCHLCQLVLCGGTPACNTARTTSVDGRPRIFCSEPCEWIFQREAARYSSHRDVVTRILEGVAPGNVIELVESYFGLSPRVRGRDLRRGHYPWLAHAERTDER